MLECPRCHGRVPEVLGAREQQCPHCGSSVPSAASAAGPWGGGGATGAGHAILSSSAPLPPEWTPEGREAEAPTALSAMREGFRLYGSNLPALLLLWGPAVVAFLLLDLGLLAWQLSLGITGFMDLSLGVGTHLRYLGLAFPLGILEIILTLTFWTAQAAFVQRVLDGARGPAAARAAYEDVFSRAPVVAGTAAALGVLLVAGAFLVVPFVVFFSRYLFAPALAPDAPRASAAFARSRRVSRAGLGFPFAVLVVLLTCDLLAAMTGKGLGALLADGNPYASQVAGTLLGWLLAPLPPTLVAVHLLRGPPSVAPRVHDAASRSYAPPAPGPAPALRSALCPGCGTPVPYRPTGAPVRVACPACGREGLVR